MSRSIVIIGGGIIGSATAYYLRRHPKIGDASVYLVEGTSIAAGASGKGGGFLALDWHRQDTASLSKLSFELHDTLAREHDGEHKWGYRKLHALSLRVEDGNRNKAVPNVDWLSCVTKTEKLGDTKTIAQAHPLYLTQTLAADAEQHGAKVILATVTGVEFDDDKVTPKAVVAQPSEGDPITIPATDVVFAAGPWTGGLATRLLGAELAGAAGDIVPSDLGTSIVLRTSKPIAPYALFATVHLPDGRAGDPEVYPRPDGTVYVCGAGYRPPNPQALPATAAEVNYPKEAVKKLKEMIKFISPSHFDDSEVEVVAEQGCFRPNSSKTGSPIIGRIGKGIYIASGHNVWGILQGPGTGKVMSEILLDGRASSADIRALAPYK